MFPGEAGTKKNPLSNLQRAEIFCLNMFDGLRKSKSYREIISSGTDCPDFLFVQIHLEQLFFENNSFFIDRGDACWMKKLGQFR